MGEGEVKIVHKLRALAPKHTPLGEACWGVQENARARTGGVLEKTPRPTESVHSFVVSAGFNNRNTASSYGHRAGLGGGFFLSNKWTTVHQELEFSD